MQNVQQTASASPQNSQVYLAFFTILYILLLIYGSLFPLSGWDGGRGGLQVLLTLKWPEKFARTDVLVNSLVYIPFGYFIGLRFNSRNPTALVISVTILGLMMCTALEYLQTFLPNRVSSLVDILLNTLGSFMGGLLAILLGYKSEFAKKLVAYKEQWFLPQPLTNLGLLVASFWALSQLTPLVPSPDLGNLRDGIKPIWLFILDPARFDWYSFATYVLNLTALALLISLFNRPHQPILGKLLIFFGVVLLLKIPIINRSLSVEALTGLFMAMLFCAAVDFRGTKVKAMIILLLLVVAYLIDGLHTNQINPLQLYPMNWIPLKPQMKNVFGLVDITLSIWPFMAMACAVLVLRPKASEALGFIGTLAVVGMCAYVEWTQQSLPGRYPDITDVLLAGLAFFVSFMRFRGHHFRRPEYDYAQVGRMVE